MPVSAAERRFILDNLTRVAEADIRKMWLVAEAQSDVEFAAYVAQAFPEIVAPYHALAAQTAATFFEDDFPAITTAAVEAAPIPASRLAASAQWALAAVGTAALDRMAGTVQRAIYNGERDTTTANADLHGMRWVRVARPDACAFCRLLASRTATGDNLYRSEAAALGVVGRSVNLSVGDRQKIASGFWTREQALAFRDDAAKVYQRTTRYGQKGQARTKRLRGDQQHGEKYHDRCHCTAKAIPAGIDAMDYLSETEPQFADLAGQWLNEYDKARDAAGSGDPKKILAEWRTFGPEIG